MTIGDRIRIKRIEQNYSQSELAKRAGYSDRTAISKLENAGDDITMKQVKRVAQALDTTSTFLMGWENEHPATVETEPGTAYVLPLHGINSEDRELLDRYHNLSPETRAAVDLLIKADQQKPKTLDSICGMLLKILSPS